MAAINETDEQNENSNTCVGMQVVFIENEKTLKSQLEPIERKIEKPQEDQDSDEEDLDDGDEHHSPVEIKLKIKKLLLQFRCKVEDAILCNYLLGEPDKKLSPGEFALEREKLRDITLWGVPLLSSRGHEGTDIVLRKFLKAKDYIVNDAFDMLQKTLIWRVENNVDGIIDEDFGSEFENAGFLSSRDREGRPVCYNIFGVFRDKLFYKKTFGSEQKRDKFLRWRIQLIEKAVKKLSFREGGVDSIVQIYDLKNTAPQDKKEINSVNKKALFLFQNYYPELTYKNIVVNAPFWFYTSQVLFSRFINQRSTKKFILARSQKVTQTLLKFIAPENLPVAYGGLQRENDEDFSSADKVSELKIKGSSFSTVEFPFSEPGVTITWDVTVVGWDVSYKEEFIPDDEGSYIILLQNQKRVGESTRNSFYISEPGKIVITVGNETFKKKKMFYRSKTRTTIPMFIVV